MAKRSRVMTINYVIRELDGDDFLDELHDPQEPIMLGSDDEFSDLKVEKRSLLLSHNTAHHNCVDKFLVL